MNDNLNKSRISLYGNLTLDKRFDSTQPLDNSPDKNPQLKALRKTQDHLSNDILSKPEQTPNVMFYDGKNDDINRMANKMHSNINHIVFKGTATTIHDEELKKIRRQQQTMIYQRSLLEQIEAKEMEIL